MELVQQYIRSEDDILRLIEKGEPVLLTASQTSTVIPYHLIANRVEPWAKANGVNRFVMADMTRMPKSMELDGNGHLHVKGMVPWEEAIRFCQNQGRTIKTYPTEQLAAIPAGVATSATGERCFGFGTLRNQVHSAVFISGTGQKITLSRSRELKELDGLSNYQAAYEPYASFKNAPFPRFELETDLVTGTEGQLGPILEVELETTPLEDVRYFFILLPPWEENSTPHEELFHKVQPFQGDVLSCEILDRHCMKLMKEADRLGQNQDIIFLEIRGEEGAFDRVFEEFLMSFDHIQEDWIFEIPEERFHHIRAEVPRAIFENNQRMGVEKKGTDIQVKPEQFTDLLEEYRQGIGIGLPYFLFGHFGNAHLHFNFLPKKEEVDRCNRYFVDLYHKVRDWQGSPFAEHGIGLVKQRFIEDFHTPTQYTVFRALKNIYDPNNIFFPMGFMSGPFKDKFTDS